MHTKNCVLTHFTPLNAQIFHFTYIFEKHDFEEKEFLKKHDFEEKNSSNKHDFEKKSFCKKHEFESNFSSS